MPREEPERNRTSRKARGICANAASTFEYATRIFDSPLVEGEDCCRDYRERRIVATRKIEGIVFVVVYTLRGKTWRIISARRANGGEMTVVSRTQSEIRMHGGGRVDWEQTLPHYAACPYLIRLFGQRVRK